MDQVEQWQTAGQGQAVTGLLELVPDPRLQDLVRQALSANPDLQQVRWQWQQSLAQLQVADGERLPTLEASVERQHNAGESKDTAQAGFRVSWQLDVWRQLADKSDAALLRLEQQQALWQASQASLAADVMQTWLNIAAQQQQLALQQQRVALLEQNETFVRQRFRRGLGSLQDLNDINTDVASGRAQLAQYRSELRQTQYRLRRLLAAPRADLEQLAAYPEVVLPLAELPQQTLARRPDLRAAYAAIEAAEADTRVAYKALLPSLNLEAAWLGSDGQFGMSDPVWSLLGQLTAPLFQGGQLQAQVDEAEAIAAERFAAYRSTLLTAVQEVDTALQREHALTEQQQYLRQAVASAEQTVGQYQQRYRQGLVSILDLLSVQQQAFDLRQQLNTATYQHLNNRITLGLALGLGVNL